MGRQWLPRSRVWSDEAREALKSRMCQLLFGVAETKVGRVLQCRTVTPTRTKFSAACCASGEGAATNAVFLARRTPGRLRARLPARIAEGLAVVGARCTLYVAHRTSHGRTGGDRPPAPRFCTLSHNTPHAASFCTLAVSQRSPRSYCRTSRAAARAAPAHAYSARHPDRPQRREWGMGLSGNGPKWVWA
jgi:hypothetical protein